MAEITLLICGNQNSGSGLQELILANNTKLHKEDVAYPVNFTGDYYIECIHCTDFIVYRLWYKPVKSVAASREGRMSIGVTIPRGFALSGGKSPYDLLIDLLETFKLHYMNRSEDGSYYEFKPGNYTSAPFYEILARYPLQEKPSRYIVMNGKGNADVIASTEQMRLLLKDTQYPEFANYSVLRLTGSGTSPDSISLEIPRPIFYKVFVNGRSEGSVTLSGEYHKVITPVSGYYKPVQLDFTLAELRGGKQIERCDIRLNDNEERVDVNISRFAPIRFERKMKFDFDPAIPFNVADHEKCNFKLYWNGIVKDPDFSPEGDVIFAFEGEEFRYNWECKHKDAEKFRTSNYKRDVSFAQSGEDTIKVELYKKEQVTGIVGRIGGGGGTITGGGKAETKNHVVITRIDKPLKVTLGHAIPGRNNGGRIIRYCNGTEGDVSVELPESHELTFVYFEAEGYYKEERNHPALTNNEYKISVPKLEPVGFVDKLWENVKRFHIILILISLSAGFFAGYWCCDQKFFKDTPKQDGESQKEEVSADVQKSGPTAEEKNKFEGFVSKMSSAQVLFADAAKIKEFMDSYALADDNDKNLAKAYADAAEAISGKKFNELQNISNSVSGIPDSQTFRDCLSTLIATSDYLTALKNGKATLGDVTTFDGLPDAKTTWDNEQKQKKEKKTYEEYVKKMSSAQVLFTEAAAINTFMQNYSQATPQDKNLASAYADAASAIEAKNVEKLKSIKNSVSKISSYLTPLTDGGPFCNAWKNDAINPLAAVKSFAGIPQAKSNWENNQADNG